MEIFAVVVLVVIIIITQHLLNWILRLIANKNDNDVFILALISIVLSSGITITCIKWIIIWGKTINF